MDIEKAKKDIIYFAENVLGFQLQEWQKDVLKKYNDGETIYLQGYRYGKSMITKSIREHKKFTNGEYLTFIKRDGNMSKAERVAYWYRKSLEYRNPRKKKKAFKTYYYALAEYYGVNRYIDPYTP